MNNENFSPDTRPLWLDTSTIARYPDQPGDITVDVCVIGAGITGLTAADLLKRSGKTVAVVDLGRVGQGETGHTSAHLTEVLDIDFKDLISNFGLEGAQLVAQASRRSIERIEENARLYGIDCDFQRVSAYRFAEKSEDAKLLEEEASAAIRAGVPNELVFDCPLPFQVARAIRFDQQAQFHPLKYLAGLAEKINGDGSYIFEHTRMLDVREGEPCRVTTDRGTIVADDVIVAANVPSTNRLLIQTKIHSYRTYAIAVEIAKPFESHHLYWDVDEPYHYIRSFLANGKTRLVIGGEDHKTGQDVHAGVHFQKLEDWAHERFGVQKVTHKWSGQVIEPVDGLPYIGRNSLSDHVYVATGFSGNGLTFGTVAGLLISDLILGQQNPWVEIFDAGRVKPLASIKKYVTENIDFPSYLIGDRLAKAEAEDTRQLRENEGALVRIGGKKVAAYRDPQGDLHLLSPVCPHMGCYVHFNDAEKSWDCPCHGSRFSATGQLLNGPALSDLATESVDEDVPMIPERYEQPTVGTNPLGNPLATMFSCPFKPKPT